MPFGLGRRKAQPTVDRQRQVDLGYVASQLAEGDLSLVAGCSTDSSVVLTLHNISLVEPHVARADGGIREKIARGLYFYVTQPQVAGPVEELVELDRGTVTITIEGITFAGKSRHIGVGFGAIESISHSQNALETARKISALKARTG
jgi:hypothetical protein